MTSDPDNIDYAEVLKRASDIMAENQGIPLCYALQRARAELKIGVVLERIRGTRKIQGGEI